MYKEARCLLGDFSSSNTKYGEFTQTHDVLQFSLELEKKALEGLTPVRRALQRWFTPQSAFTGRLCSSALILSPKADLSRRLSLDCAARDKK
jgi:hypothetical protein